MEWLALILSIQVPLKHRLLYPRRISFAVFGWRMTQSPETAVSVLPRYIVGWRLLSVGRGDCIVRVESCCGELEKRFHELRTSPRQLCWVVVGL
jgi:hypothetical protein